MVSLLRRLQTARAVVTVKINNNDTIYNSMVIDVSVEDGTLFLDELTSEAGHKKMKKKATIHFDGRLKGVRIQFSSQISGIDTSNSIAMYRIALPKKLVYWQRRRHYRAKVMNEELHIQLPLPFKQSCMGKVLDISASGICSQLDYPESAKIEAEQIIQDATLTLPGQSRITCDMEVKSVRHFPEQGYSLVGTEFSNIIPRQQSHVERIVAMLDRTQRRRVGQ